MPITISGFRGPFRLNPNLILEALILGGLNLKGIWADYYFTISFQRLVPRVTLGNLSLDAEVSSDGDEA